MHCSLHKINGENCWWMSKVKEVGNLSLSLLCINLSQFDCSANVSFFFFFECCVMFLVDVGILHGYRKEGSTFLKNELFWYILLNVVHLLLHRYWRVTQTALSFGAVFALGARHFTLTTLTDKNNEELTGID